MSRKASFIFEKSGMSLHPCGPPQERLFRAWCEGLPPGAIIDAEFRKHRHPKTLSQLGYWYGVLMPFARDELVAQGHDTLFDVTVGKLKTGVATTTETADILFKTLYAAQRQLEAVPLKRRMTDEEMGNLIDFAMDWLARELGVTAPPPNTEGA